jgi:hypothetical protein
MPINIKPENLKLHIPVGDDTLVLVLRACTTEEVFQYFQKMRELGDENMYDASSHRFRFDFIDSLLIDIKALNEEGNEESVVYSDPETGEEKHLTPQMPEWKTNIDELYKLRAATQLEQNYLKMESAKLKN